MKFRYKGFLSYNSSDMEMAQAIERVLEHYSPPRALKNLPRRINIFRYEGDMVGTDYDSAISNHLLESEYLLVICSQAARNSDYVGNEIDRFIDIRDHRKIIPILVDGSPNNEASLDHEKAFPDELYKFSDMPIAVDFRNIDANTKKVGTGPQSKTWFQLLAAIYGVSREDIEERDRVRRVRTMQGWLAFSATIALVLAFFASAFYLQRNSSMRAQAELLMNEASIIQERGNTPAAAARLAQALRLNGEFEAARGKLMNIFGAEAWQLLLEEIEFEAEATTISFSADGNWLATGASDGTVMLWDVSQGTMEFHETLDHGSAILVAGFTSDSKQLVYGGGQGTIRIHDVLSGPVADLQHEDMSNVRSLLLAHSGEWIATGTSAGTLGLWRQSNGSEFEYQQYFSAEAANLPNARIRSLQVSSDEEFLMSRSFTDLRIWNIDTGNLISNPVVSREAIVFAEFLNDDPVVLISYEFGSSKIFHARENEVTNTIGMGRIMDHYLFENGIFRVISQGVETSATLAEINTSTLSTRRIQTATFDHRGVVESAKFSDDGMLIATSSRDNSVKLWTNAGEPLSAPLIHPVRPGRPAFGPDGDRVATTAGTKFSLWSTGKLRKSQNLAIDTGIRISRTGFEINFSPNGKWIGAAGTAKAEIYDSENGTLKQSWSVNSGLYNPSPDDRQQVSISFSQDSEHVLITTLSNTVILGNVETGRATSLVHPDSVRAALFSPNGRYIVTIANNGSGYIWPSEISGDGQIHEIDSATVLEADSAVLDVAISSDSNAIVAGSLDGAVYSWNSNGNLLWSKQAHSAAVNRVSTAKKIAVSGSRDSTVKIWDALTGEELHTLEGPGAIFSMDTRADGSLVVTASSTEARIWDAFSGELAGDSLSHPEPLTIRGNYRNAVMVTKFSPLGGRVATGARDGEVRLWDVQTSSLISDPLKHRDEVLDLAFDSTGNRVAVASRDRRITIWNLPTGKREDSPMIASVAEAVSGLSMSADNTIFNTRDRAAKIKSLSASLNCSEQYSVECSLKKIVDRVEDGANIP